MVFMRLYIYNTYVYYIQEYKSCSDHVVVLDAACKCFFVVDHFAVDLLLMISYVVFTLLLGIVYNIHILGFDSSDLIILNCCFLDLASIRHNGVYWFLFQIARRISILRCIVMVMVCSDAIDTVALAVG